MNFHFQQMKPIIQQDFDTVLAHYPTDLRMILDKVPMGGDPLLRKQIILEQAAELCPVHIFPHYPFAFELDMGEVREVCYVGLGNEILRKSGVDLGPLQNFQQQLSQNNLGMVGSYTDFLHRTLDHDKLLSGGFRGVYETCARLNETETDPLKRRFRETAMICCRSVEKIGLRLRALAKEMLPQAEDEDVRYNLIRIINSVNTPWEAPETLFDALNTILCTTLFISGLDGVEMNAYGQLDRLVEPFYRRDLEAGRITEEEAYFLIQCFLHKTDMHCHFNEERKTYDNGVSVMIGGCDLAGRPLYNAITDMVLQAYTDNRLINPKLNARASAASPRAYIEKLAALMQTGHNNLVIENDDYIIPMFLRMGLSPEDARTYVGNGCQEVICRNQVHSRAFVYLNLPQMLLDTLRLTADALPESHRIFYARGDFRRDTFDALYASFLANLRACIQALAEAYYPYEAQHGRINPETMLSCFTDDCIARGVDMSEGGARYNHKTLSFVGFGTLCDSLLSLRRAYGDNTLDALLSAMAADFQGYEPLRQAIQHSSDRFGHSEEADQFARRLAHDLSQVTRGIYSAFGTEWGTSLFTYYMFSHMGYQTAATPDGRHAHAIFSRQMNMASIPDFTSAALSMSALTDADFHDVGMLDLPLPHTVSHTENAHQALTDYIRTCLQLRIPVLQTNVADVKTMQEERDHKGTHPDLVVRVCGFSAIFSGLDPSMQDEIIHRAG